MFVLNKSFLESVQISKKKHHSIAEKEHFMHFKRTLNSLKHEKLLRAKLTS